MRKTKSDRLTFFCGGNRTLFSFLVLVSALLWTSGCGRTPQKEASLTPPIPTTSSPADLPAVVEPSATQAKPKSIAPEEGLTSDKLLRRMLDTYAKAKYYSDDAYVESLYEITLEGRKKIAYQRCPGAITFEKPNLIRMAVNEGLLISNGKVMRGQILLPAYHSEYAQWSAPLLISSIGELYPDARLARAMELGTPDNIFWAPPQLVMLLSKNPLKTFLPDGSSSVLLDPALLIRKNPRDGKEESLACDRVRIVADDGARVLWINRDNNALVRFEFPLELLEVPKNVDRFVGLTMEFPNVVISSEPRTAQSDRKEFEWDTKSGLRQVDAFLPLSLKVCGVNAAEVSLRPLASGYSEISLDKPQGACRVLCFWRGSGEAMPPEAESSNTPIPWPGQISNYMAASHEFLRQVDHVAKNRKSAGGIEFISVNTDPVSEFPDERVRMMIGGEGTLTSLYRFRDEETRKNLVSTIGSPSILVIDKDGIIQKYYRKPVTFLHLERDLKKVLQGKRLYEEDLISFHSRQGVFQEAVKAACDNDCFRLDFESTQNEVIVRRPQVLPQKLAIEKLWSNAKYRHPCNPIAAPLVPSLIELGTEKKVAAKGAASGQSTAKSKPEPFIIVPCEGNSLVLLDRDGQPIKKVTPRAASGELVNLVRSYRGKDDKVFFVASARKLSRLVHRFDGRLEELGTLDIGSRKNQKVADLALADLNQDGTPELLLGLLGDTVSNELPVHGLYAVDLLSQNILWKDESVFVPARIGFMPGKEPSGNGGKPEGKLLSLNLPEGVAGGLIEDETLGGERLNELLMEDGSSIQWFGAESLRGDDRTDLVVLSAQQEPSRLFLAGIGDDRRVKWKSLLPIDMISPQLDTITTGDVDGDGVKDWIVFSPDGMILFYSTQGELMDQFQYGAEITGVCVVHRGKERFLVVTDVDGITAWRFK